MPDNAPKVCQSQPTKIVVLLSPMENQVRPEGIFSIALLAGLAVMRKRNLRQGEV